MNKTIMKFITVALLLITATISCKKDEPVNAVILEPSEFVVVVGKTATLTVTFIPNNATNKKVNWTSSNPNVATVENGIVTGIAVGQAKITVISQDGEKKNESKVLVIKPIEPEMIRVEGGTFIMGCTDEDCRDDGREEPAHQVTVSTFNIGKYSVTQLQWKSLMGDNPSYFKGNDNLPVEMVSRNDVQQFIQRLNAVTGKNYRLPTEAEWEYASRGGKLSKGYKYSGSDDADMVAWYADNSKGETHPVGAKEPNELGIYDMSGNVLEYCSDFYGNYSNTQQTNPTGPTEGLYKVARGGAFEAEKLYSRVAARVYMELNTNTRQIGFRLVLP